MKEPIHIISLGAGVQSSTMALMAAKGEITPMPTCAIFADTQSESQNVYQFLDWLVTQLPFPVIKATAGSLTEASIKLRKSKLSGNLYLAPTLPVFVINDKGKNGMMLRQCTRTFKIDVVRRESRRIMKQHGSIHCFQWIGISTDESLRMKESNNKKFTHIWPLIDKGFSRTDCLKWMKQNGFPTPPRSACVYCPYRSDADWIAMKQNDPQSFALAVDYEKRLNKSVAQSCMKTKEVFLHSQRIPLDKVDFNAVKSDPQMDLFNNECEGMCGV